MNIPLSTGLSGLVKRTAVRSLRSFGIALKCENEQVTGSFKWRGAINAVLHRRPQGVIAGSSGNHGIAVARAAKAIGIPAIVVMMNSASPFKRSAVAQAGATIVDAVDFAEREQMAASLASAHQFELIAPDSIDVMAGNAMVASEILAQWVDATTILVPVGNGGLLAAVAVAVSSMGNPASVVGVEPVCVARYAESLRTGRPTRVFAGETICDGAIADIPSESLFTIVQDFVDDVVAVPDDAVLDALRLLRASGIHAEPTAALSLAGAIRTGASTGAVCIITGGNADSRQIDALLGSAR